MQFLKNLGVSTQLMLGFSTVIVLLIGLGAFSVFEMNAQNTHVIHLRDNWLPAVRSTLQMQTALVNIRVGELSLETASSPSAARVADNAIKDYAGNYDQAAAEYEKTFSHMLRNM